MKEAILFRLAVIVIVGFATDIQAAAGEKPLVDKTLVAWVQLADLSQRAGSVLTIIDPAERFDAIVFGERLAGRWMAGSDFFRRTWRDQAGWPAEIAKPGALVQIAVVYRGRQVIIYRNGLQYASYEIAKPQAFGVDAMVLIGLRYVGDMGEIGFFKGSIDDARIYDRALTPEQIASLKPNEASDPRPLAWWDFENARATDRMGRFSACRLMGEARIADGKLSLDGDGYVWAAKDEKSLTTEPEEETLDRTVHTMFYKARSKKTGNMWDVWLYHHQGTYFLYYLAKAGRNWNNISMATSPDGVHWRERGPILTRTPGAKWMGTGSTWKSPNFDRDGKFFMNFSEWMGPRQNIHFAESKDLLHWTRLTGEEYRFAQDEQWYEPNGRWDCIWAIARPGGGLYGYWTASPKAHAGKSPHGGEFGFGESLDGVHWKALPPPTVVDAGVNGGRRHGEVGAVEKIGDKYYMMFGHYPIMVTLVADRPEGPFHRAKKNYRVLAGHTYFSRFFPHPDGMLACHFTKARNGQVSFAPIKDVRIDNEGTLRLGWWKGNEKMKHKPIAVEEPAESTEVAMLGNSFDINQGVILEGTLRLPTAENEPRRGVYVECTKNLGAGLLIDSTGVAELGQMKSDNTAFKAEKGVDREMKFGKPARFRLLIKGSLMEFYLDDILIESYALPENATGRIGLVNAGDAVGTLKAWR